MQNKTIVNLISAQTIPNYLFIKEFFIEGDDLLFITSKTMLGRMMHIVKTLGDSYPYYFVEIEEEDWFSMTKKIEDKLSNDSTYYVNTTCGTKFMSLSVQSVFQQFNARFFYIPNPENKMLAPFSEEITPIHYRVNISEYFQFHNIPYKEKFIIKDNTFTEKFFKFFTRSMLNERDFEILELLRENYRD